VENNLSQIPSWMGLIFGGFAGTVFHTIRNPEKTAVAWLRRAASGMIVGIGLGGYVATKMGGGFYGFVFAGFIFGAFMEIALEVAMHYLPTKPKTPIEGEAE